MTASKKGIPAHQMHRMLGVTCKTAWFMCHRIREAMTIDVKSSGPLGVSGKIVEARSILNRRMKGVYQHCVETHLHRYLTELTTDW